jgi:hypothetical protein
MKFGRFKLSNGGVSLLNGEILVAGGASQPELYDRVLIHSGQHLEPSSTDSIFRPLPYCPAVKCCWPEALGHMRRKVLRITPGATNPSTPP